MNWIVAKIRWIMLAAGVLSCSMLYAVVMPREAIDLLFDRTMESELAQLFVSSWAALGSLMGAMLIYAAFAFHVRTLTLTVVSASKLAFLGLMLAHGRQYLDEKVGIVLAVDVATVALFALFMFAAHRTGARFERASQQNVSRAPRADEGVRRPPQPPLAKVG